MKGVAAVLTRRPQTEAIHGNRKDVCLAEWAFRKRCRKAVKKNTTVWAAGSPAANSI